jgi:tetratricopeptide (TPR) repeat protein/predicted Ser/Thr protein kinase
VVDLAVGTKVDRYVVDQRLGVGGMGVVYSAWDSELAREVALKIVRPRADIPTMHARLRREAKAMARLSHRNVVPVFDIASHDGQLFIAMELVTGETLRSWVSQPRPWRDVVRLFAKAARGLEAAHAAGLLHRDFKPDNVMVGANDEPRITDFGLAHELDDDDEPLRPLAAGRNYDLSHITATGSLAGTPAYMAPEQLLGLQSDAKADQFSFCVALFEVLYGARPFATKLADPEVALRQIRAGEIAKPAATRGVPGWLHAAILRGLAFDPAARWPSMRALVSALERGRRRRWHGIGIGAAAIAIVAVVSLSRQGSDAPPTCAEVAPKGNDGVTILVCKDEYARSNDPKVGIKAADALRGTGALREATILATELLATPVRADALYTLGMIAVDENRNEDAERSLRLASTLHREQQQWGKSAADLLVLSEISRDAIEQLVSLDQAASDAQRGHAPQTELYCRIAAASRLSEIGARTSALTEVERAQPLAREPGERIWLDLKRGDVYQTLGEQALAITAFQRALTAAEAATIKRRAVSARLNLAYSLAESGKLADAANQLKEIEVLDRSDDKRQVRLALAARIADHTGDLAGAAALLERSIALTTDAHDVEFLAERETQRAELALHQGALADAETWARRAIADLAKLASNQPPIELRSWLFTQRRSPSEILFTSLARQGDAAGALVAFDRYRGLGVLAQLAHADGTASPPAGIAFPTAELARLLPPLATSALATPAPERAVLDAARAASLLVLVVARGDLWRITGEAGQLLITRIGALGELRPALDRFRAAPGDRSAASALGALLIPAQLARPSTQILHVVLDESLAWLPVAALRIADRPLIAARPIVQPARPSDAGCVPRPAAAGRVIVIDNRDDLAPRISSVWPAATRAAVFDAARSDVLHVAVATEHDAVGDALVVRDGRIHALEIAGHGTVPARVVLAPRDPGPGGTAPLAMAFLAAGADQVIATVGPVSREATERLTDRLYHADTTDLARALAQIQAAGDDDDLLGFAAFGHATCNPSSP